MALGRTSPFTALDPRGRTSPSTALGPPRPVITGQNLQPSAALEDPFAATPGSGDGQTTSAAPSPVTGMTPQANSAVGNMVNLAAAPFGFQSIPGIIAGLAGLTGPANAAFSLGATAAGKLAGIPTTPGGILTSVLNAIAPSFPLSVNPNADPTITFSEAGLGTGGINQGQAANAMAAAVAQGAPGADPTTAFGLANIAPTDYSGFTLGSYGAAGGFGAPGTGNFAGNPAGAGVSPAPPGGYIDAAGNLSNANVSTVSNSTNFGAGAAGQSASGIGAAGVAGGIGDAGGGPGGVGAAGVAGGIGDAGGGPGGVGDGAGGTGGVGDAGGGDGSGNYHQGGFVGLNQDAQDGEGQYAQDQDDGSRGESSDGGREVDAKLQQGEFVVNKEAAGRFGPILNKLNDLGRNQQLKDVLGGILEQGALMGFKALLNR